jgi:DNA primase
MAGRIPDETLQALRDRVSLVEVVSAYVNLKRAGRNHLGLCPFHSEKTPSFTVSEERGLFHCFGCGAGGTVFNFVMRMENVDFPAAVEQLARRVGFELPRSGGNDPAAALRERMMAANEQAVRFFRQALSAPSGAIARQYLNGRGLRAETVERYDIGYAPPGGTALAQWLDREKVPRDLAVQVGLLGRRSDGGVYDRFRGRVMFPIRDRRARVVAFGGRTLGDDQPKYLNSPESPVFRKGQGLYGLAEARDGIRSAERVVLVEGYLDALLLVQEGIPYTVATLGTALGAAQLRLLRPFGGAQLAVHFFFDGDEAGRRAALRAFSVCAEAGVWGRAAFLPDGFDPDRFIRERGLAATLQVLEASVPLVDFYLDSVAPAGASLPERTRAADLMKGILSSVSDDVQFEVLARHAATRLGVGEDLFRRARSKAPARMAAEPAPGGAGRARWPIVERTLIEAMAADCSVAQWVDRQGILDRFGDPELASAGHRLVEAWDEERPVAEVLDDLPAPLAGRLTEVLMQSDPRSDDAGWMKIAEDCVARIEENAARLRRRQMVAEVRRAETDGDDEGWRVALRNLDGLRRRERGSV